MKAREGRQARRLPDQGGNAAAGCTPDALLELGPLYCAGREDVAIDLVSAHQWFNLAAIRGNAEAKRYRMEIARQMYETGDCEGSASGAGVVSTTLKVAAAAALGSKCPAVADGLSSERSSAAKEE